MPPSRRWLSHQIEVGRLIDRIRESNNESIGRLNVIVAQPHGECGVRERELLSQTFLRGARLVLVSTHRSWCLFQRERDGALVVRAFGSLLDALGRSVMGPVEYAPAIERGRVAAVRRR